MKQDRLKLLTDLVQQLQYERNSDPEPEDLHVTISVPVTDLTVYPELTEALPSIKEDLFRYPLTDEECKIAINSCPRTTLMKYNQPPLNYSASSVVKKADFVLIQETPVINIENDFKIIFASSMRSILSDIAVMMTQAIIDNLHKGLEILSKPTQLVESGTKPLTDQQAFDALITKNPATKRQLIHTFRKCQKNTMPKDTYSSKTDKMHIMDAETASEAISNRNSD
ncbi:hypothetical protein AYI70_g2841 [Smittium culicis]|uniref:Uncharacterized protein n=1 Tax=Smittium culicis TaxID=133412 RepID=A0A1R1Y6I0_9FUNG|nr:hypothetical protein AYI70_g2841 [Smittium culicis]